jgi:uncharacterized protein (TIGR02145 family)
MKKQLLLILSFLYIYGCSSSSDSDNNNTTPITDADGNVYQTVTICDQTWTQSNLNVSKYTDGTLIPQVTEQSQWANLTTGAWCYFENNTANGTIYGKLYNWYAVAGIYNSASATNPAIRKKLAPTGWHISTDAEWTQLTDCLGGIIVAGGKLKSTGISLWLSPNTSATNESGFTALPGSFRYGEDGSFGNYLLGAGYWWCDAEQNQVNSMSNQIWYSSGVIIQSQSYKKNGFSVRCVKD